MKVREGDALVIVDVQNDFADSKGTLYVKGSEKIFPNVKLWIDKFVRENHPIFLTKDWHPVDHISFKNADNPNGWPVHCVINTWGADTHPSINVPGENWEYVLKGIKKDVEEYSGFAPGNGLDQRFKKYGIKRMVVVGLATDYCVKATVLDGLKQGYDVSVVSDAIAGVDINPGDSSRATHDMVSAGAIFTVLI